MSQRTDSGSIEEFHSRGAVRYISNTTKKTAHNSCDVLSRPPLKTSPDSVAISLTMSMRGLQNVVITAVTVGLILSKNVTALQQRDEILLERSNFVVGTGIYDM